MRYKYLLLLLVLLAQCRTTEEPTELGYHYFPLEIGKYWVYQMDSLVYNNLSQTVDTHSYQIKEMIDTSSLDNEGELQYHVEHFYRSDDNESWKYYKQSVLKRNEQAAERIINSQRMVSLIFPVNDYKTWDVNSFNSDDELMVRYLNAGTMSSVNNANYNQTVRIEQEKVEDQYFHHEGHEIYAFGVGLIFKEYINTETQNGKTGGTSYKKTLIASNWQ